MTFDIIDHTRQSSDALETRLQGAGSIQRNGKWRCPDPAHEDKNPSGSVHRSADGIWRLKCHACGFCGDAFDVEAIHTGRPVADILREARQQEQPVTAAAKATATAIPNPEPSPAADMSALAEAYVAAIPEDAQVEYLGSKLGLSTPSLRRLRIGWRGESGAYSFPMRDAMNQITGIRLRSEETGKNFAVTGTTEGIFIPSNLTGKGPLIVCEGPTDCAAATDMGFDAIGRANNCSLTGEAIIATYIRRHPTRPIWIIHDADPDNSQAAKATIKAAHRLAAKLATMEREIRVFAPPPPHKDIRDWRNTGATMDDLEIHALETPTRGPSSELGKMLDAEIDGTRAAIPWPWPFLSHGTQALIPATLTIVAGAAGAAKSFFLLQALAHWHDAGIPWAAYQLEEPRAFHLKRALAQRVGASWLTDLESVKDRPGDSKAFHAEHSGWLDSFGRRIYDAPTKPVTLLSLVNWVRERAEEGARIIAIDPITAAMTGPRIWDDTQKFLMEVLPILTKYGASLILVTHRKKGGDTRGPLTLDDLAGGAGWQRHSQCVLWIQRHDEPEPVELKQFTDYTLTDNEEISHTLYIAKTRNGRGNGWKLGFQFDPETLTFDERGIIDSTQSTKRRRQD